MAGVGGEQMQELIQLRHWLTDAQREHSGTVDVSDQKAVKEALRKEHVSFCLPIEFLRRSGQVREKALSRTS